MCEVLGWFFSADSNDVGYQGVMCMNCFVADKPSQRIKRHDDHNK